jgi:hypothetical protein
MAALTIAAGAISLMEINEKIDQVEICVKAEDETVLSNRLSNDVLSDVKEDVEKLKSSLKLVEKAKPSMVEVITQDETGTSMILPCNS